MKYYYYFMSRVVMMDWMLKEFEVEYEWIVIDFIKGESNMLEFCVINLMGKILVLVDDDMVVMEDVVICVYFVDKFFERVMVLFVSL